MPDRDGFPAGVPAWIDTEQPDPDAAARFYQALFGWRFEDRTPDDRTPTVDGRWLVATLDGRDVAAVSSSLAGARTAAWNTYVGVASADGTAARVAEAGGRVLRAPSDIGSHGRAATCVDPSGAEFRIWQPREVKGAQAVNVSGAWNWSDLHTDDVDVARRFYGDVFGWEVDEVELGEAHSTMIRLPGYADFLEQFDPGIRQRHADFGAPPGFSECVGWMHVTDDGDAPHWSVTFTVDDTDGIARAVRELGGTVAVEPFEVAPVRSASLVDPQGAAFSVNSFNPG